MMAAEIANQEGVGHTSDVQDGTTLRIGINGRALEKPDPAGVSHYTRKLVEGVAERTARGVADLEVSLFGVADLPDDLDYDCLRNAAVPAPAPSGPRAHLWEQARLPIAIERADLDVFHTPAGQPPVLSRVPQVTTVHDVSPIAHPEWFSTGYATLARALTPLAVRRSERVITVSEFARTELEAAYPLAAGKTVPVYNGVTEPPDPGAPGAVDGLVPGYLLYVGSTNPRKNLGALLTAYREYRRRESNPPRLVLAGPDREIFADDDVPSPDGVRTLGYVPDETLGWLYRNAGAFAFPSQYEGFGLPILEAMSVGTPVVTDERGATAEVAGDGARLVDGGDPDALAAAIHDVLADGAALAAAGRERAATFGWDRAAAETIAVYREVAATA